MSTEAPASISAGRLELRRRCALLSHFEPDWLGTTADENELEDLLTEDCELALGADGLRHWSLSEELRKQTLASSTHGQLLDAWNAVSHRPADDTQWAIDTLFVHQAPLDLGGLGPEQVRAVAAVSRWRSPSPASAAGDRVLRSELARQDLFGPFDAMLAQGFVGRVELLAQLDAALVDPALERTTILYGVGGVGKSAVLAKHLLAARTQRNAIVAYLNFDDPALDPRMPPTLVGRIASQLAVQLESDEQETAEMLAEQARDLVRYGDKAYESSSRSSVVQSRDWQQLFDRLAQLARPSADRPMLVILDTFEQVQRREETAVISVADAVDRLQRSNVFIRVVVAGRAPEDGFGARSLLLDGLSKPEATTLLQRLLGPMVEADALRIIDVVGTSAR